MTFELHEVGQQHDIALRYHGTIVGAHTADLPVEDAVLVELKAVEALDANHQARNMNYLKATRLSLCLLLNFGQPHVKIKRVANGLYAV